MTDERKPDPRDRVRAARPIVQEDDASQLAAFMGIFHDRPLTRSEAEAALKPDEPS